MTELLTVLLRIAGLGLLLLASAHVLISKRLRWREDAKHLTPLNAEIFHVHAFFICVLLVMMGLPCLLDPAVFLERSRAGSWMAWSFSAFWALRLYCQWFVYQPVHWRGKPTETFFHWWFTMVWTYLAALFAVCGLWQLGYFG